MAAIGRKAVEHGPHELHQRRFAGFVFAVKHDQRLGQVGEFQVRPDAKSIDADLSDFHAGGSSPLSKSAPNTVASASTAAAQLPDFPAARPEPRLPARLFVGQVGRQVGRLGVGRRVTRASPAKTRPRIVSSRIPGFGTPSGCSGSSDQLHRPGPVCAEFAAAAGRAIRRPACRGAVRPPAGPAPATFHRTISSCSGRGGEQ